MEIATHGGEPTRRFSLLGGLGDLQQDRYNLTATASYFLQGGYTLADRANTRSQTYGGVFSGAADYWNPGGGSAGAALSPCPSGTTARRRRHAAEWPGQRYRLRGEYGRRHFTASARGALSRRAQT